MHKYENLIAVSCLEHFLLLLLQCAEDPNIRELIRQYGGLIPLVNIVNNPDVNPEVLLAATGAIWKLSLSSANVAAFQKLGIIPVFVRLLSGQPEKVRDRLWYFGLIKVIK